MCTLKEGDIVRLKSGSPRMTVSKVNTDGTIEVEWVDINGVPHTKTYRCDWLELD
jgi:uncharacterized protein YodC (DUF2158 family)